MTAMEKFVKKNFFIHADGEYILKWVEDTPMTDEIKEAIEDEKSEMVKLLRWILKHYSTGTDIDGFFMWENPIGKEFNSLDIVNEYYKTNHKQTRI